MKKADKAGIAKLQAFIANNTGVQSPDLLRYAKELGYDPRDLIDATLGATKFDISGARMTDPLEDILNQTYEGDSTPGGRFVLGKDAKSTKAKALKKIIDENLGVATSDADSVYGSRRTPGMSIINDATDEMDKLRSISHAGHEIRHMEDDLIRPNLSYQSKAFEPGHHAKEIFETDELIRDVRGVSRDEKIAKEVAKQSAKKGLKSSAFKKLASVVPFVGPAIGAGMAVDSNDVTAALPFLGDSESAGMSGKDEQAMLEEIDRVGPYEKGTDDKTINRWNKIKDLLGK